MGAVAVFSATAFFVSSESCNPECACTDSGLYGERQ